MFLFFSEGPRIGRKSGSVGLKPSHSSLCLSSSGKSSFAHSIMYSILFFDGGFFKHDIPSQYQGEYFLQVDQYVT